MTVWQRLSRALGPDALLSQDFPTYKFDKKELLIENAEILKTFKPFDDEKMKSLRAELEPFYKSKKLP